MTEEGDSGSVDGTGSHTDDVQNHSAMIWREKFFIGTLFGDIRIYGFATHRTGVASTRETSRTERIHAHQREWGEPHYSCP